MSLAATPIERKPSAPRGRPVVWHLAALALAAAAPFVAIAAYLGAELVTSDIGEAHERVEHMALETARRAELLVERNREMIATLAARPGVKSLDPRYCDPLMDDVMLLHRELANVFTIDAAGGRVCSTGYALAPGAPPVDPRNYIDEARVKRAFVVGRPTKGALTRKWIISSVQPLFAPEGEITGFVGVSMNLLDLASLIQHDLTAREPVLLVVDSSGVVLTHHPDDAEWIGRDVSGSPIMRLALERRAGSANLPGVKGVERVWAFAPVRGTDWTVLSGVPTQMVMAPVYRTIAWIGLVAAACIAILGAICVILARRISRPIVAIAGAARRMTSHGSIEHLVPAGPDEIVALAHDLNTMLDRRRDAEDRLDAERTRAHAEVQVLNSSLERRVGERTAELEGLNRELKSFDYSISHDLRAPINRIRGFTDALLDGFAGGLEPQAVEFLGRIRASAVSMDQLVSDLLSLSTLSRSELRRAPVDLSAMASGILEDLRTASPYRDVKTVVAPGVCAEADPGLMRVVLENLLGNAWKFTSRRAGSRIEFGADLDHGVPHFFVRDNGAGFDPKIAGSKLFEPFRRLHSQSEFPGAGIGLATVERIVRRHGGRARAEGAVGGGATISFTLAAESA